MRKSIQRLTRISAILLALAISSGCGGGKNNPVAVATADVTIDIVANNGANSFSPNPTTVKVGQTVAWRNQDGQTHTATSDNGTTFNTGNIASTRTSTPITMTTQGSFPYHCALHSSMVSTLVVNP